MIVVDMWESTRISEGQSWVVLWTCMDVDTTGLGLKKFNQVNHQLLR